MNLQLYFTNYWNETHPHDTSCAIQSQPVDHDFNFDVDLICSVDSSDLDDLLFSQPVSKPKSKSTIQCTCPNDIRPYKHDNEQWSLQKAISFTFDQALDKLHTMNVWSCGLDPQLTNNVSSDSIATRAAMTLYAINDVLAPTRLLFHLDHDIIRHLRSRSSSIPTFTSTAEQQTIDPSPSTTLSSQLPSYFVLSDSHARHLDPLIRTKHYQLHIHAISGLKWRDDKDTRYCAHSLIYSNSLSSSLTRSTAVMFLIGTNSIRYIDAAQVIQHVSHVVDYLQRTYPHLNKQSNISIVKSFPCYKTTSSFPSISSLSSNIEIYNEALQNLSKDLRFSVVDFHVQDNRLANDHMHLHFDHRHIILDSITDYFNTLRQLSSTPPSIRQRSADSKKRRNKIKHRKMQIKRSQFILTRSISVNWKPKHIKYVLLQHHLNFARILEVHNRTLPIQFNNATDRDIANTVLPDVIFDVEHFHQYFPQEQ